MQTLDEIAIKMGTDKSSLVHSYTQHYEKYFASLRNEPIKLLEIGIQGGASLWTWKEYFPKAHIYGFDFYDSSPFEEERVTVIRGDQNNEKDLERITSYGVFDIIIDDGSHKNGEALKSFEYLFPRLAPGGLYVIEDINVMYWGKTHNIGEPVMINRLKGLVDDVMAGGKSGIGDHLKDQQDGEYIQRGHGKMTWWEKNVRFVHFYRSMAFIGKHSNYY